MPEKEHCLEHSGFDARIKQCEDNDRDIFKRLRVIEMSVYKAAGASGVVTALVISLAEKWMGK